MTNRAGTNQPVPATSSERLSVRRLLLLLCLLGGIGAATTWWASGQVIGTRAQASDAWFAPYVDVTLPPSLHFEDPAALPADAVVLGFIVADPSDACEPSWGTYYSLDAAARALDLDRRIVRLRERGGDAIVSFGGAFNDELAVACTDPDDLAAAYQAVVDRYGVSTIEFDLEGAALSDSEANARRATALQKLKEANPDLAIWLTLPVAPYGLDAATVAVIDQLLAEGVELAGVNVMTMNYGGSRMESTSMAEATEAALLSTWQQLDGAYQRSGQLKTESELWKLIGATPMIGQNDVSSDVFSLADARALLSFSRRVELGRLSFWSANRDVSCGAAVDDVRVSNTCSGVEQTPLQFTSLFTDGTSDEGLPGETPGDHPTEQVSSDGPLARDDPRTSPYPIWREAKAYEAGAKVVWQGRVYEAKWWSQADQPDAPVEHAWDTPWRYLGPVLESDREAVRSQPVASDGSRPNWVAETVYVAGDEVQHNGQGFRAKWWTQGIPPQEDPDQPYDHPWEYLGELADAAP